MFGQGSETTNQRRLSGQWRDGTFDPVLYANVAPRQEDGTELTDAHLGSGSFNSTGSAEPVDESFRSLRSERSDEPPVIAGALNLNVDSRPPV